MTDHEYENQRCECNRITDERIGNMLNRLSFAFDDTAKQFEKCYGANAEELAVREAVAIVFSALADQFKNEAER